MKSYTQTGLLVAIVAISIGILEELLTFITQGVIDISFSGLIAIAALILIFVGRKEFGERHKKFVFIAAILFIFTIVITVIFFAHTFFTLYNEVTNITYGKDIDLSSFRNILLIAPITAILSSLFYLFLLYNLQDYKGKILLYSMIIASAIVSFYILIEGTPIVDNWISQIENTVNNSMFISQSEINEIQKELATNMSRITLIGAIPNLITIAALYNAYHRIKSGSLVPLIKSSNQKKCMNCGRVCPSDYVVCPDCGTRIQDSNPMNSNFNQYY